MTDHKLKTVAFTIGALLLLGAAEPTKIEFNGWYSNPVFSADGKLLAYCQLKSVGFGERTAPSQIVLLDAKTGKEAKRIEGPADDSLLGPVAFSPDGKRLAIGMWNTAVRLWDLDAGKEITRVEGSGGARNVRFTKDGRTLGWLKNDEIYLADATNGKALRHFGKDTNLQTTDFAFVDDGKTILSSGHGRGIDVSGAGAGKLRTFQYDITDWALETASGKKLKQLGEAATEVRRGPGGQPQHFFLTANDGKTVFIADQRGHIQRCDWITGKNSEIMMPWKLAPDETIRRVVLSANGKVIAFESTKNAISVWDLGAAKELQRKELGQDIEHLALSPDGKKLAVTHNTPGRVGAVLLIYNVRE